MAAAPPDPRAPRRGSAATPVRELQILRRSRATLPSSFDAHHAELFLGEVPCCGQRCQKQPSTNTAIRARVNAMSGVPGSVRRCTRYRTPSRCSSRRSATSTPCLPRHRLHLSPDGLVQRPWAERMAAVFRNHISPRGQTWPREARSRSPETKRSTRTSACRRSSDLTESRDSRSGRSRRVRKSKLRRPHYFPSGNSCCR